MSAQNPTAREFAAIVYALAIARGKLSVVQTGDFDKGEVEEILRGTSAQNIAKAIGLREADIAVNWNDFLSEAEMNAIRGGK